MSHVEPRVREWGRVGVSGLPTNSPWPGPKNATSPGQTPA